MRPDEADLVQALWTRAGLIRPWNDPVQDIALALRSPCSTILVARASGSVVASAMVGHDGHRGAVYYVATDPDARGQGLGRAIMDAAEAWLTEQGVAKLNLLIRAENQSVRGFYQALGYAAQDRIAMQKEIG
jgi:ribosomal protein S18 acetylase RimI-like enzyme